MALGQIKRSRKKIENAFKRSEKTFKQEMRVYTVSPVFRSERGYAAYVCFKSGKGARKNVCANTAYGSTPTKALAKAFTQFAKLLRGRR